MVSGLLEVSVTLEVMWYVVIPYLVNVWKVIVFLICIFGTVHAEKKVYFIHIPNKCRRSSPNCYTKNYLKVTIVSGYLI